MNTEDMDKLAECAAKTMISCLYKMTKILMELGVDYEIALALATTKLQTVTNQLKENYSDKDMDVLIKEWEEENV